MRSVLKHTLILLFLLLTIAVKAQTVYPIRTITVINGATPYTLDGFVSQPGKLQVQIISDDVTLDQYAVKLKMTIQSTGVRLYTRPTFVMQPLYLDGGTTLTLSGMELEELFNPDNLIFEGYSRSQYNRNKRLPEGVYRISFEVLDYYRNVPVARAIPGIGMMYLTRAPRLTLPLNKSEYDPTTSNAIRFSWLSFQPANPMADVIYRFKLWEVKPEWRDPYEVIRGTSPLYETDVNESFLLYDVMMPTLADGMYYAWRVEAIDKAGETIYQNDGLSEVYSFQYGTSCSTPVPSITSVTTSSVTVSWKTDYKVSGYRVLYKTSDEKEWTIKEVSTGSIVITSLNDNTNYEIKIVSICGNNEGDESKLLRFKTNRDVNYTCGSGEGLFDLSNTEPLPALYRFDQFKAADFIIEVADVEGENGRFSGTGYALVPYLGFAKFMVKYDDIVVNTDNRMVDGEIQFVYDEVSGMIVGLGGSNGEEEAVDPVEWLDEGVDEVISTDKEVNDVTVSNNNTITITYSDGSTESKTVEPGKTVGVVSTTATTGGGSAYVADTGSGRVYTTPVPGKGDATNTSKVATPSQTGKYGCSASFEPAKNQRFGFDAVGNSTNKPTDYFGANKAGDLIAWKSLRAGQSDYVYVTVNGDCSIDSLRYLRDSGLPVPSAPNGKAHQLLLTGGSDGDEEMLIAAMASTRWKNDTTKEVTLTEAGAINLVSYEPITMELILVPVNGSKASINTGTIKQELDKIYSPAVVDWSVTLEKNIDVANLSVGGFETEGVEMLSKYTDDMNKVIKTFKKETDYNRKALILFFVDAPNSSRAGFMPLTGNYGFIFSYSGNAQVLAHELAHGGFNLRHTFSSKAQYYFTERTTSNLMDYSNSKELWKYQWDLIHDPQTLLFAWAQDESEGAFVFGETAIENIVRAVRNVRCAKTDNAETANLYFSNYSYSIEIKDLVTAFNWAGSDVSDEKIKFYISNDGEINLDYFEDEFDVKNIQYNESKSQVVIKGKERSLFVEPYDAYSDHKAEIYSFIKTMFDGSVSIKEPTEAEVNGMELDKLRYLSVCQLALMSDDKRKETLKSISGQTAITAKDEKLVINLLRTTKDKSIIYSLLKDNKTAIDLYNGLNTYKQEFVYLFNWICESNWSSTEKQGAELIFLGTNEKGVKYQLSEVSWFDDTEENKIPVWNLEDLGGGFTKKFNAAPSEPIRIAYFDGNTKTVSTVLVDYIRSQENKEEWTQAFFDYLNGVGLSSAGRLLVVKSTPALIRFLAIVEFGKTNIDIAFTDENLKTKLRNSGHEWFVDNWQTISTAIDVATFGSEMLINFAKKGDDLSRVLRENGNVKAADEIDDITAEAKALQGNITTPVTKYPVDGFREIAEEWTGVKSTRFKTADDFYKKYKPSSSADDIAKIDDELRGVDFDEPVSTGTAKEGDFIYSWVYPKRGTQDVFEQGNVGQYFTYDKNLTPEVLGIPRGNRILRKFKVTEDMEYLKSTASDITWRGNTEVYTGGGEQFYIPNAKGMNNLELVE